MGWVYGIRIDDVKRVMIAIESDDERLEIVYMVGKVAVLYEHKAKTQRHYR